MKGLHPEALQIDEIVSHTRGLASIAEESGLATAVPTCGEWTMGDLVTHLFDVQSFWVHIIGRRPAGPDTYEFPEPPDDPVFALRAANGHLADLLASADPGEHAWSWSDDHTVGFTIRRQIHEAVVHHADAALGAGVALPPVDPLIAADGVDELVDVMLTGIPAWATFLPNVQFVRVHATDTDDRWTMSLGSISGTSTDSGVTYDGLPAADRVGDDVRPDLTIAGSAVDLLLWAWGRISPEALSLTGETEIADALRATVVAATQ